MADLKLSRRERAQATRRAIVRAAHAEFAAKGYHGATMATIAEAAGVATQTVYFVFHTKADLISAVIDAAVMGDQDEVPQDAAWFRAMVDEPDAAAALRLFVQGSGALFERASDVAVVLRAAAGTDEDLAVIDERHERLRREGFAQAVALLATKGRLRDGRSVEQTTDVLLMVYGDASYQLLRSRYGWTHDQVMRWLTDVLPDIVLDRSD